MQRAVSRPSRPPGPCSLETAQKGTQEAYPDNLLRDHKSKATHTLVLQDNPPRELRTRCGNLALRSRLRLGAPRSSGHSWGSQGLPPAGPPLARSLLGGIGLPPTALARFVRARPAPKDPLFLTATVGRSPRRSRGRRWGGRWGPGLRPGLLRAALHALCLPPAVAAALS